MHYADKKEELAKRAKHEAALILKQAAACKTWERVPQAVYREVRQETGLRELGTKTRGG